MARRKSREAAPATTPPVPPQGEAPAPARGEPVSHEHGPAAAGDTSSQPRARDDEGPGESPPSPGATPGPGAADGAPGAAAGEPSGGAGAGGASTPPHVDVSGCLCGGLGPALTQALRTLIVSDEVKRQVHATEREALRLLRTVIEMRLASLDREQEAPPPPGRGTRLTVE